MCKLYHGQLTFLFFSLVRFLSSIFRFLFSDAKNLYVRLGNIDKLSKYWLLRKVEKIFHHKYEHNDKNDIAVLKLSEEVEYTKFIQPICLFHNKTFHLKNYQYCKLIGFGAHVKGF